MSAHGAPDTSERVRRTAHWNEYNAANSPEQADASALWRDWQAVGDAMRSAIRTFEAEHASELARVGNSPAGPVAPPTVPLYSGPIPSPATLARYEKAVPGAADRIMTIAERELAQQQTIEMAAISNAARRGLAWLGLWIVIALAGLMLAGVLTVLGQPVLGFAVAMLAITAFTGALAYGTRPRSKDRAALHEGRSA